MPRAANRMMASLVLVMGTACGGEADPGPRADPSPDAGATLETPVESPSGAEPRFTAEITVVGGKVTGPKTVEVDVGEKVSIAITSDVADHVHVHGYDELVDVEPGERAVLRFTAGIPGVWEVELEDAHQLLFELKVQ